MPSTCVHPRQEFFAERRDMLTAARSLGAQLRSLWHDLTSNDRHASVDSPFRSGSHHPLPQTRHTPLTSVAATALDSRTDLGSPYKEDGEAGHGSVSYNGAYTPGMRSTLRRQSSGMDAKGERAHSAEIQMQSFSDGLPPPPPVFHSWKRIDRWLDDNYEELSENLCDGATMNDVNELEHQLNCTLPPEVRESLVIHDGQERGGMPTGVIFGCMLLDCEEIAQEWQQWRTINEVYFGETNQNYESPQVPLKALAGSSSHAQPLAQAQQSGNPQWRQELLDKQDSQPSNAVQKAYAHPSWIPLARDWGGNNICVDLAPAPAGKWGQIILTGRDYDCKYVVARSWAAFLATLSDDMSADKWFIDEDSKELKLREFKQQGVEPAYIDILRWRSDQKYGRKAPKRAPNKGNGQASGRGSPYSSPTEDRGRSPQRFQNGKAPVTGSPRALLSSPLAMVTEELPQPLILDTHVEDGATKGEKLVSADTPRPIISTSTPKVEKLVPVDTPISSEGEDRRASLPKSKLHNSTTLVSASGDPATARADDAEAKAGAEDGEMRDVEI